MTDISDLRGVFPTPLRWNAEGGVLGRGVRDEATGERDIEVIELGSPAAKFVMDYATRERGYGLIRIGVYDMRLQPCGSPPPEWPGDEDFKPAIGCWFWNPPLGELRLETNQSTVLRAINGVWDHCRTYKEAAEGLQPVIHFVDRREKHYKAIGKSFWAPVIDIIGWVPRDKVPAFALRPPTVKPSPALDSQIAFALLETRRPDVQIGGKTKTLEKGDLGDFLDDEIPELEQPASPKRK
jgi:hypothetical protein